MEIGEDIYVMRNSQRDGNDYFLPVDGAEEMGNVIGVCVRPGGDFWLIQADSYEPLPKCSVEEILPIRHIHPEPLCPLLSLCTCQTLLTPSASIVWL